MTLENSQIKLRSKIGCVQYLLTLLYSLSVLDSSRLNPFSCLGENCISALMVLPRATFRPISMAAYAMVPLTGPSVMENLQYTAMYLYSARKATAECPRKLLTWASTRELVSVVWVIVSSYR